MSGLQERTTLPGGLVVADTSRFKKKTADFAAASASNMHAVFDFDRTLTVKKSGSHDEVTTWHILCEHLPFSGIDSFPRGGGYR